MIKFEIDNDEEKAAKEFIQQHSESCKVYNRPTIYVLFYTNWYRCGGKYFMY